MSVPLAHAGDFAGHPTCDLSQQVLGLIGRHVANARDSARGIAAVREVGDQHEANAKWVEGIDQCLAEHVDALCEWVL
jgi:hypothetical protein